MNFTRLLFLLLLTALSACSITSHSQASRTSTADREIAEPTHQARLTDSTSTVPR